MFFSLPSRLVQAVRKIMINDQGKKKIRLMTRIAIYEKTEGRKNEPVARYFRSDYIGLKILSSVICATVVFLMIIGLYVLCNSETLMVDFYRIDLLGEARKLILAYIAFVSAYVTIVAIAFFVKYNRAVRYKRIFSRNLKKLLSHYGKKEDFEEEDDDD
ncbi:MAG: hypothetical protein J5625_10160 [Lachnospiraceae bacterium]|nr:hypothetical protein [Lachnospiraceae bacterium]